MSYHNTYYILGVWEGESLVYLFLYSQKEDAKVDGKKWVEKGYKANVFPERVRNRSYGAR